MIVPVLYIDPSAVTYTAQAIAAVVVAPNQWDAYIRSAKLDLSFEELRGRAASSIQFVRFRCPSHLPLMVKVKLHSVPTVQDKGKYSFSITPTPPDQK